MLSGWNERDARTNNRERIKIVLLFQIELMDLKTSRLELIQGKIEDFWNELSIELQQEIKKGLTELDQGKRISYESFLKKISR